MRRLILALAVLSNVSLCLAIEYPFAIGDAGLNSGADSSAGGLPRFAEGHGDIDNANPGDGNARTRYYEHEPSPIRHIPLGFKIGLGALMLVTGAYYFSYAIRNGPALKTNALLFYALLGIGGIFCGITLGLYAISSA